MCRNVCAIKKGVMMKVKNKLYIFVLSMILQDKDKLWLTGKQRSQIESLIYKLENL